MKKLIFYTMTLLIIICIAILANFHGLITISWYKWKISIKLWLAVLILISVFLLYNKFYIILYNLFNIKGARKLQQKTREIQKYIVTIEQALLEKLKGNYKNYKNLLTNKIIDNKKYEHIILTNLLIIDNEKLSLNDKIAYLQPFSHKNLSTDINLLLKFYQLQLAIIQNDNLQIEQLFNQLKNKQDLAILLLKYQYYLDLDLNKAKIILKNITKNANINNKFLQELQLKYHHKYLATQKQNHKYWQKLNIEWQKQLFSYYLNIQIQQENECSDLILQYLRKNHITIEIILILQQLKLKYNEAFFNELKIIYSKNKTDYLLAYFIAIIAYQNQQLQIAIEFFTFSLNEQWIQQNITQQLQAKANMYLANIYQQLQQTQLAQKFMKQALQLL